VEDAIAGDGFFYSLDDLTPEVGATCLVLGSRRIGSKHEPPLGHARTGDSLEDYPSRVQLCAQAEQLHVESAPPTQCRYLLT